MTSWIFSKLFILPSTLSGQTPPFVFHSSPLRMRVLTSDCSNRFFQVEGSSWVPFSSVRTAITFFYVGARNPRPPFAGGACLNSRPRNLVVPNFFFSLIFTAPLSLTVATRLSPFPLVREGSLFCFGTPFLFFLTVGPFFLRRIAALTPWINGSFPRLRIPAPVAVFFTTLHLLPQGLFHFPLCLIPLVVLLCRLSNVFRMPLVPRLTASGEDLRFCPEENIPRPFFFSSSRLSYP